MVALIPLIALLWQSQQDFDDVSYITTVNTQFYVSVASELRDLELIGQDVERLIMQYQVLPNAQLDELADFAIVRFEDKLAFLCNVLGTFPECSVMKEHITTLRGYADFNDQLLMDAHLSRFAESVEFIKEQVNEAVAFRINEQQAHLDSIQKRQGWSTGLLVVLSLALIILAAQLILKPIKKLQEIIHAIAKSSHQLPEKSVVGPKELRAVETDLFWLNGRLQQLEKVRTALLRHASHELKTPLACIKEGCAILQTEAVGQLSEGQTEVVGLLNNSTERLNLLVVKLLDYNALLQQAQPSFVPIDITEMIDECVSEYQLLLAQNDQQIDIQVLPKVKVVSDVELLRRILDNLVSNAIAYANISSTIVVRVSQNNQYILLDVLNSGNPIDQKTRAEIFEPFKRGSDKRNDKVMGAGLGLSIVSDCSRLINGDVAIIDTPDADVCFRVRLPRRD
ncbi:HAMP domain-containing histidine kinase [Glaciecola sp. XM2]|jgi:two-component system sensor histidine kinase GlrK|nr:HAMP domain-containing sensor histidine kinase [Glaciecola sp. XM2]MBT1450121.1 HAMP domain-containing histidine kinase [Glaciecola sp. XM2]